MDIEIMLRDGEGYEAELKEIYHVGTVHELRKFARFYHRNPDKYNYLEEKSWGGSLGEIVNLRSNYKTIIKSGSHVTVDGCTNGIRLGMYTYDADSIISEVRRYKPIKPVVFVNCEQLYESMKVELMMKGVCIEKCKNELAQINDLYWFTRLNDKKISAIIAENKRETSRTNWWKVRR